MELIGRMHNGTVIFDHISAIPEGASVRVIHPIKEEKETTRVRTKADLPFVKAGKQGTFHLTNEMIADIFDQEDVERYSHFFKRDQ